MPRYVFVVTYGRSGSTLMQGLLNALPGVLVRGESSLSCCRCTARGPACRNTAASTGSRPRRRASCPPSTGSMRPAGSSSRPTHALW